LGDARYLYSVVRCSGREDLGAVGIEESQVYTIPCREIAAVVHSCQPRPYQTEDKKHAEEWVLEHSYVIDLATRRYGTVLPFSFDVIVQGGDEVVAGWLDRNYDLLADELRRLEGRAEYSVEIYYDYDELAEEILRESQELRALKEQADGAGKGAAYLLQRRLELRAKDLVSSEAARLAGELEGVIRSLSDEVKAGDKRSLVPERYRDKRLLAAFSCLVRHENVDGLGDALEEINSREGFAVRFTGPWAPFSFVKMEAR
jgi:hypothetical protein